MFTDCINQINIYYTHSRHVIHDMSLTVEVKPTVLEYYI